MGQGYSASSRQMFAGTGRSAVAYIDGGSRGNPGPAGYGVSLTRDDGTLVELKGTLGIATNNVAEYLGLLAALEWATDHGIRRLHVRSDSELLVRQMRGQYRVKHSRLRPLWKRARRLVQQIGDVGFTHIRRELNRDADRLANEAMDEYATHRRGPTLRAGRAVTESHA